VVGGCQKTLIAWTCDSVGLLIVDCCLGLLDLGFFFFFCVCFGYYSGGLLVAL
jgi:tetrahydromethanopterin S-methyltransferase subunit D